MSKLTVKELEALRATAAGTKLREDGGLIGSVRARSEGVSVYFDWRYRFGGKVRQISVGAWPDKSMPEIRRRRDRLYEILQDGKDPAEEKRIERLTKQADQAESASVAQSRIDIVEALKARVTVQALFEAWEKRGLKKRKDKGAEVRRSFEKDLLPALGAVAAEDVTKSMIVGVLDNVVERGAPIVARNLLGDIRQMFGYAIEREILEHDPTSRLKRDSFGKKVERERTLTEAEIKALPEKLKSARFAKSSVASIWVMLSTCCRVGEISRAEWKDVDIESNMTWHIPAGNSKNSKAHTVYLSPFAVEQFKELQKLAVDEDGKLCKWVLPARWTDQHVSVKSLAKQVGDRQRGDKPPMKCRSMNTSALELPGGKWTPHDLRRTGATMMGVMGVRPDVIEKCLNHVEQNKVVRIYQRQKLEAEQAEAWRLLGERLELLLQNDANNVVLLRSAA